MSLIKEIKKMEEILFDVKIRLNELKGVDVDETLRKLDDGLDILSKMKQNKIVLRGSIIVDETDPHKKFRKFHGLCG